MKYVILCLFAVQTVLSLPKTDANKTKSIGKINCKDIKCPPIDDPICVKMKSKKLGLSGKNIHIMLFNSCEMEYMKCHDGLQVTVVSMKNCEHTDTSPDKPGNKRVKREIPKGRRDKRQRAQPRRGVLDEISLFGPHLIDRQDSNSDDSPDEVKLAAADENASTHEHASKEKDDNTENDDVKENAENVVKSEDEKKNAEEEKTVDNPSSDTEEITATEANENEVKNVNDNEKGDENEEPDGESENDIPELDEATIAPNTDTAISDKPGSNDNAQDEKDEEKIVNTEASDTSKDENDVKDVETGDNRKPDTSATLLDISADYDVKKANEEVDFEQYDTECPSVCPAREVMVCAKCKDGIYRTFMSICHLRMFNCKHPDEKLELVSRYPCVLSAPYLASMPESKGRLSLPSDSDLVLRFIRCREKDRLNTGDGDLKCNFGPPKNKS